MDSVYELVGLWMTIQTLAWHLNSLDGIAIVADAKGAFYSESEIRFSNLPISQKNIPKNYPELEIWNSCPYQ